MAEHEQRVRVIDEHRARTEQFSAFRSSVPWIGVGTFWLHLEKFVSRLNLDPERILKQFDSAYAVREVDRLIHESTPIIGFAPAYQLTATLPFWELLTDFNLAAVAVPAWRYQAYQMEG
jgi:hypothetical protein